MIECMICNRKMKGLTLHLIKVHSIKPVDYLAKFPDGKIFSDDVLAMSNFGGKSVKGKRVKPFTAEHKAKLSAARKLVKGYSHSDETKQKMSAAWHRPNRAERIAAISARSGAPENRLKLSIWMKAKIERDGFHLKRGKVTALEAIIHAALNAAMLEYSTERRSHVKIDGSFRYYDIYVPKLNLIIEADGEFWHMLHGKHRIDQLKAEAIEAEGLSLLRISDKYDAQLIKNQAALIELILDKSLHKDHTTKVLKAREAALAAQHPRSIA